MTHPTREQLKAIALQLEAKFSRVSKKILAIDGPMASGKSTIARYLAYYFGVSTIELDLYREATPRIAYRTQEVARALNLRQGMNRGSIVDGLDSQHCLRALGFAPDILILIAKTPGNPAISWSSENELHIELSASSLLADTSALKE